MGTKIFHGHSPSLIVPGAARRKYLILQVKVPGKGNPKDPWTCCRFLVTPAQISPSQLGIFFPKSRLFQKGRKYFCRGHLRREPYVWTDPQKRKNRPSNLTAVRQEDSQIKSQF